MSERVTSEELAEWRESVDACIADSDKMFYCFRPHHAKRLMDHVDALEKVAELAHLSFTGWVNQKSDFAARMTRMRDALAALRDQNKTAPAPVEQENPQGER